MKKAATMIIALFLLGFIGTSISFAEEPDTKPEKHQQEKKCLHKEAVPNLSPEQKEKIDEMRKNYLEESKSLRTAMGERRKEFQALWKEDNPNAEKILAKLREMNEIRTELQEKMVSYWLEVHKLLKPQQRKATVKHLRECEMGEYGGSCH